MFFPHDSSRANVLLEQMEFSLPLLGSEAMEATDGQITVQVKNADFPTFKGCGLEVIVTSGAFFWSLYGYSVVVKDKGGKVLKISPIVCDSIKKSEYWANIWELPDNVKLKLSIALI